MLIIRYTIVFIFSITSTSFAQSKYVLLERLKLKLQEIDSSLNVRSSLQLNQADYTNIDIDTDFEQNVIHWMSALKSTKKKQTGVELGAAYDHKLGNINMIDDSEDDYVGYRNKYQLSLSWNILNSGFYKKSLFGEKVAIMGRQKMIKKFREQSEDSIQHHYDKQQNVLNALFNRCITSRIELYVAWSDLQNSLVIEQKILAHDVTSLNYQIMFLKSQLKPSSIEVDWFLDVTQYMLAQFSISPSIVDSIVNNHPFIETLENESRLIANEENTVSYWDDVRIAPYLKAQYYDKPSSTGDQISANVGITMSIPLSSQAKAQKNEVNYRQKLYEEVINSEKRNIKEMLLVVIHDLNVNFESLASIIEAENYYRKRVMDIRKLYEADKTSIQSLCAEYNILLNCQSNIYDYIYEREDLIIELISNLYGITIRR